MKASATAHYQPYAVLLNESKPNRCRREGVRGREDSLGGRAIPQPLSMGNRGADCRHGLAMHCGWELWTPAGTETILSIKF